MWYDIRLAAHRSRDRILLLPRKFFAWFLTVHAPGAFLKPHPRVQWFFYQGDTTSLGCPLEFRWTGAAGGSWALNLLINSIFLQHRAHLCWHHSISPTNLIVFHVEITEIRGMRLLLLEEVHTHDNLAYISDRLHTLAYTYDYSHSLNTPLTPCMYLWQPYLDRWQPYLDHLHILIEHLRWHGWIIASGYVVREQSRCQHFIA